jgi:hypothetical protein
MSESGGQMPRRLSQKSNRVRVGRIQYRSSIVQQEGEGTANATPSSTPDWRGLTPAHPA